LNKGVEIARGKTKALFEFPEQADVAVMKSTDNITAGDGSRRNVIEGKGRLAAQTTARVFRLLNLCGFPTHYLSGGEDDDDNEILVRRCEMIPLEVVTRGVAAGSYVKRKSIPRGTLLVPRVLEFFIKDDANHDPMIELEEIVAKGIASPAEVAAMGEIARMVFEVLSHAWRRRDVLLIDLKIEFGRLSSGENKGALVIADVIDNDAWRIWPQGREELMLDKQMYRNLKDVTPEALQAVFGAYEKVAELVGSFPQMRSGMVAVFAEDQRHLDAASEVTRNVQTYGVPLGRHVASSLLTPTYVIQLVQQLDATFSRLVFVTSGPSSLYAMVNAATTNPVVDLAGHAPEVAAQAVAKAFGLDDTVLFGRVMLMQANRRSAILQADAQLNAPPPPPPPGTAIA
jgi:phosphoribosylaminoimidazole-succinocarboxamide synthase